MLNPWQDLSRPPLRESELRRALITGSASAWRALDVVEVTGSTNADLAERARNGEDAGAVLVADEQTAGRGRRGRSWQAPPRAGLAISVLLRPDPSSIPADRWSWLNLLAGLAVSDALIRTCGLPATLKWPNDVLVPGRAELPGAQSGKVGAVAGNALTAVTELKVAGLLAEVVRTPSGSAVVLGLGINVSQEAEELPVPTATSLTLAGSATTDRDTVLRAVLRALAARYRAWSAAGGQPRLGLAAEYRERCSTIGRTVQVQLPDGTALEGLADGVDDEGRLLVLERPSGPVHALSVGDVVHIRPPEPA